MFERVLLVAWKGSAATAWVDHLKAGGFTVLLEDTTGERAWRTAKERGIDVVIIDGQKKPSHGRQTGHALRDTAKTRNIPIIWTNLDTEDAASVQAEVKPDLILAAPTNAGEALAALQSLEPGEHRHEEIEDVVHALNGHVNGQLNGHAAAKPILPGPIAAPVLAKPLETVELAPVLAHATTKPTKKLAAKPAAAKAKVAAKKPAAKRVAPARTAKATKKVEKRR